MIDEKTLLPMVKKLLPNVSDADIMAGIREFAKTHPNFNNAQALQALILAIKQMQGQTPQRASRQPFGQGIMNQLGVK